MMRTTLVFWIVVALAACASEDDTTPAATQSEVGGDAPTASITMGSPTSGMSSQGGTVSTVGTTDPGGSVGDPVGTTDPTGQATSGVDAVPAIVLVGYAGVRAGSLDLGVTWPNVESLSEVAGDDENLLRAVAYGDGVFVAAGWKIFTSTDAASWQERVAPLNQWLGGLAFGNGLFVGAGGFGYSAVSDDAGSSWVVGASLGTEATRSLAFGNGIFVAATDAGNWWESTDGTSWSVQSGGHSPQVAFCDGAFAEAEDCAPLWRGHEIYLRPVGWGSNMIQRSLDGRVWTDISLTHPGVLTGAAFGYISPQ